MKLDSKRYNELYRKILDIIRELDSNKDVIKLYSEVPIENQSCPTFVAENYNYPFKAYFNYFWVDNSGKPSHGITSLELINEAREIILHGMTKLGVQEDNDIFQTAFRKLDNLEKAYDILAKDISNKKLLATVDTINQSHAQITQTLQKIIENQIEMQTELNKKANKNDIPSGDGLMILMRINEISETVAAIKKQNDQARRHEKHEAKHAKKEETTNLKFSDKNILLK